MPRELVHVKMLIDGAWIGGADLLEVRNPANPEELVGTAIRGKPADVERAIAAAKAAQRGWAKRSFVERAKILGEALDRLKEGVAMRQTASPREQDTQ
jgi:acyl-CoA reductase-like NAD-dependent aldehyde dehydrogenase